MKSIVLFAHIRKNILFICLSIGRTFFYLFINWENIFFLCSYQKKCFFYFYQSISVFYFIDQYQKGHFQKNSVDQFEDMFSFISIGTNSFHFQELQEHLILQEQFFISVYQFTDTFPFIKGVFSGCPPQQTVFEFLLKIISQPCCKMTRPPPLEKLLCISSS